MSEIHRQKSNTQEKTPINHKKITELVNQNSTEHTLAFTRKWTDLNATDSESKETGGPLYSEYRSVNEKINTYNSQYNISGCMSPYNKLKALNADRSIFFKKRSQVEDSQLEAQQKNDLNSHKTEFSRAIGPKLERLAQISKPLIEDLE